MSIFTQDNIGHTLSDLRSIKKIPVTLSMTGIFLIGCCAMQYERYRLDEAAIRLAYSPDTWGK